MANLESYAVIRLAQPADCMHIARMCEVLWPDATAAEHALELTPILEGKPPGTLPLIILVAQTGEGAPIGFLEVGLRSHADGCDTHRPVGFVEGLFVVEEHRRKGVAAQLMAVAEDWARAQGCMEMASDTWVDNAPSQQVHEALGFEEVDRCVNYRKPLWPASGGER
jgi:aminoglycoside 6'-N-acetyltransferase I